MSLVLRYAARSDRGLVRSNNQDSVYAGPRLLAVADGMGGHAGGEIASKVVIAAVAPLDDDEPGGDLLAQLNEAVQAGNEAIIELVEAEPDLAGMGTTLTAVLFAGSRLGLAHVGDSRAYLVRDDALTQITHDDTFVQSLVDEGRITEEEAANHPQRSLILRALNGDDVQPSLTVREARPGDRYLLCSDGLSGVVSADTLTEALRIPDPQESADRLVELALRSGGPDNITVIVADVLEQEYGEDLPIVGGAVSGQDVDSPPPNTAAGRAAAMNPTRASPRRVEATATPPAPPSRGRRRALIVLAVLLALAVVAAIGGRAWLRSYYYVGERDGSVAVLRGAPGSVLGVALQELTLQGCVSDDGTVTLLAPDKLTPTCNVLQLADLQPAERTQVSNGLPGTSLTDARAQITRLVTTSLLPLCTVGKPGAAASRTPTAPTSSTPASASASSLSSPSSATGSSATGSSTPTSTQPTGTDLAAPDQEPGQNCRTGR
ncbi:MAG: PP2C family serine/threonine-protein phosphatase [Mycobacteriaceae bacterium]